jgi:RHS repeat-associated protein
VTEKFTGKERDAETGNDYFGARYLSSAQGRFTSPDPSRLSAFIESPQTWNMYVYAYNNPLQFVDENGSWPTQIHNKIIDAAFPNLTTAQRQILKDVSAHQDAILTDGNIMGGQAGALSFQHAMRDSGQSVAEAESDYNYFVSLNEDEATRIQIGFWAAGNQGFSNNALAEFALALHAILDSTSPSHAGFQVWELSHLREHKKAEASITPQQLNAAVSAAQNAFNTTFHPTFNFVFGQPGQQQSAPNKPKKPKQPDVTSKICYTLPDGSKVCQ